MRARWNALWSQVLPCLQHDNYTMQCDNPCNLITPPCLVDATKFDVALRLGGSFLVATLCFRNHSGIPRDDVLLFGGLGTTPMKPSLLSMTQRKNVFGNARKALFFQRVLENKDAPTQSVFL
jgi:hypothetical protein